MGCHSNMVHDGVKVLVLIMWLILPIINAVSLQDILNLVANFHLGPIADELSRSFLNLDMVLKSVDELLSVLIA